MKTKMTACKACGKEIASSAKACPECGAKNKKPIFKKWWFWVVIVLALIAGSTGSGGSENSGTSSNSGGSVVEEVSQTMGQKNALSSAKNYLRTMPFSYSGLIRQLEFEGYSTEDATYAADNCDADWNEQAAKSAKNYLNTMSFSRDGLIEQLEFEGYTHEQAVYGVEKNGY